MNTTTATPTPEALAIAVIFKDFEIDHTPDGWPAVKQMHLSAAAAELERQHAEIERLTAELEKERTARQGAQLRIEELQAHLVRADAERCKAVAAERERLCALIKAADDKASEGDYMLDSDDCISVIKGTWNHEHN